MNTPSQTGNVTFLFTEIEGSTRLWEQEPERMKGALASHDAAVRTAVEGNRGLVIKMTGVGVYAAFENALDGVLATVQLQLALADPAATHGVALRVRGGLHAGVVERRDNDFFGSVINRAARIMGVAHGGQVLVSAAVAAAVRERLPAGVGLRELGSVRLRGLDTAEHVYQVMHPQLRQDFPALSALEGVPDNLPEQTTSFVDRERERADVAQLLGETRLLTLLGTVGIGKTRLALQVAAGVLDDYPDGVWLVDLEAVSDPGQVENAVAHALSVSEETNVPLPRTLAAHLAHRTLLLILDHCEHLIDACARVADALLRSAPQLRILATSSEPLRVPGEQTVLLSPLALPPAHAAMSAQSAGASAAVQLFVDRARLQQPEFALTDADAPVVAAICARLDGIPLAIEVAAAWMGALALDAIAARVADDRILVELDRSTAADSQRALTARLDRSYDLLSENDRLLLNRLAAFDASFDIEAAEQVCGAPPLHEDEVLDLLTALVDKSLVFIEPEGPESRFRQFEVLRLYARERARKTPAGAADAATTRARHAGYLAEHAKSTSPKHIGPE